MNLINEITELVIHRGYEYKDIAVLTRANFHSRIVEEAFSQHKIPYHIENGLNFYNQERPHHTFGHLTPYEVYYSLLAPMTQAA